jgi:phosphoglycolate phosphatase-like HAD superfamily hydrolase
MVGDSLSDLKASNQAGVRVARAVWDPYDRNAVMAGSAEYTFERVDEMMRWFRDQLQEE